MLLKMKTFVSVLAQTFRAVELLNRSPKYRPVADDMCSCFSTVWLKDVICFGTIMQCAHTTEVRKNLVSPVMSA